MNTLIIFENVPEDMDKYLIPDDVMTLEYHEKLQAAAGHWINSCSDEECEAVNEILNLIEKNYETDELGPLAQYKLGDAEGYIAGPISHVYIMGMLM